MEKYQMMIYGAGNSEIAERLEEELNQVYSIRNAQLRIYAKSYIFANSCFAMYKRFKSLKEEMQGVKSSGVYEYTYEGGEAGIKTQQLYMQECANPAAFENFLLEGIEKMPEKEIILILIGQSYGRGLFLDCYTAVPMQLTYDDFFGILRRVGQESGVYFHLILDISSWHRVMLPYELAQIPCITSLFIWQKTKKVEVFPIKRWIETSICRGEHWLKVLYKEFAGYRVIMHAMWWQLCQKKWQVYRENPCALTWKSFYESYKDLLSYGGTQSIKGSVSIQESEMEQQENAEELTYEAWKDYFLKLYEEHVEEEDLGAWLEEMKNCISYYKL